MASRLLAVLKRRHGAAALAVAVLFLIGSAGCSVLGPSEASYPTTRTKANRGTGINKPSTAEPESIFGPGGLSIGGPRIEYPRLDPVLKDHRDFVLAVVANLLD